MEELTDQDVRGIYEQLSHEDKKRFRQFRKFHRQYFGVYGEHLPSYDMARQVMKDLMPGLPSASADVIAAKRAELLAEEPLERIVLKTWLQIPRAGDEGRGAPRRKRLKILRIASPAFKTSTTRALPTTTREEIKQMIGAKPPEQEQTPSSSQATDPRQEGANTIRHKDRARGGC